MKTKGLLIVAVAALLAACGEETRNGTLTLSGSAPLKIADKGGQTVEFFGGPLKIEFSADSGRKFTIKLEQNGRKAEFSGRAPGVSDWNVTVYGRDIGQPANFTSKRTVTLYGPTYTSWGRGGFCGFNGTWETEETWQKGNEDWSVAFNDAASNAAIGTFASRKTDQSYLLSSRNVWCRERPEPHEPHIPHGRWSTMSNNLSELQQSGVKFN